MEDEETFGWPIVRAYHAVWLQHLEQGRASWNDEITRHKLQWALVWHRIASSLQPPAHVLHPLPTHLRLPLELPGALAPSVSWLN